MVCRFGRLNLLLFRLYPGPGSMTCRRPPWHGERTSGPSPHASGERLHGSATMATRDSVDIGAGAGVGAAWCRPLRDGVD
jgi:hypothetical protein